ncbi:M3 family oligoendopeptidase [Deinococcus pimensis]|uniref:M3 family oligoendopeptidase n=1 Tax=Deinococcus pimensis TaxID=309888 RepID=UPI0004832675|nr:M3 family oligoendopeptidase [Deinococcus pimensis]
MTQSIRREDLDPRYTWDLTAIFPTEQDWSNELDALRAEIPGLKAYEGRLGESGATLLAYLEASVALATRLQKATTYAFLGMYLDMRDPGGRERAGRAQALPPLLAEATAFDDPELLSLGAARLAELREEEPRLDLYARVFERLEERRAFVRSAEVEAVLGQVGGAFAGTTSAYGSLTDTDMTFPDAPSPQGPRRVSQNTVAALVSDSDREVRRAAFESFADEYLAHRNTLADLYVTRVRQSSFTARVRGYASSVEGVLAQKGSSMDALNAVVEAFKANVGTWHRYWRVRRRALGLERLEPWDVQAPFSRVTREVPYDEAVETILASVAPLGESYVSTLRKGLLEDRWVDVYPTEGKPNAQFASPGAGRPFVMMSYSGSMPSLGVLAHELGHATHMQHFLTAQPEVYHGMGSLECEVPSNLGQMMLRAHLLAGEPDTEFALAVLDEAFANFYRYFFQMPLLARFELEVHAAVDRGEGLTADRLSGIMTDLLREGWGDEVTVDGRAAMMWAQFGHLYSPFYTFEYTVGISCAAQISADVLAGKEGAVEGYLAFLRAGSSLSSLDALKLAGVDLTTPEPIERGFEALSALVNRLEGLVEARERALA